MTHRLRPLLALLALVAAPALAQQTGTVSGTVLDGANNQPLPGVNVVVQGTTIGSTTDGNGRYVIPNAPVGEQAIRASFIGYQTTELRVTVIAGQTATANFTLQPGVLLDDVVVTALGIERAERSLGYSVQQVTGDELALVAQQNFMSGMQGRVAGATFNTSNSMGGSTRIVLRGVRSLAGNNQPLIVIDGVVLDNTNHVSAAVTRAGTARDNLSAAAQTRGIGGYDYGNAAGFINADDVESVTVLQGSTAAALYGSRAANGVIQIVTRSGRMQQGMGIQVNSTLMASSVFALPGYQNDYGGGSFRPMLTTDGDFILGPNEQYFADYATDQSWGPRLDGRRLVRQWYSFDDVDGLQGVATPWEAYPNNVRQFFETGLNQNHNVAFTHGGQTFNYRLSYSHQNVSDVFPNAQLVRNQFALNGGASLTPRLRVNAVANYVASDAHGRPGTGYDGQNVFQQFNHFGQRNLDLRRDGPMANIFRSDGSQRGWNWRNLSCANPDGSCPQGRLIYFDNPYWVRMQNVPEDDMRRFFGTASLGYELMDGLRLIGEVRTDQYTDRRQQRLATFSQAVPAYLEEIRQVEETSVASRLQYDRPLTEAVSLTGFVGTEYSYRQYHLNTGRTAGGLVANNLYTLENSRDRPQVVDYYEQRALLGLFGEATVGYMDYLYLTGTLRNDWTSTLPEGGNAYLYPSVTGAFVFTSLPALQNQDIMSFGKLRAGWAQTGNDTEPYRLALSYPVLDPFDGAGVQTLPGARNNPELRPERTTEFTGGLEARFLQNRLGLDLTLYHEISEDQILPVAVSRASGFSQLILNTGEITNTGFTLALNTTPVVARDFRWDFNANIARNRNEVVSLSTDLGLENYLIGTPPFGPQVVARVGEPYGAMWGTAFRRHENGQIIIGTNGLPATAAARQVVGNYVPDATFGFGSTFAFRNVSANVLFSGQLGGDIFSVSNLFGLYSGLLEETVAGDIREVGVVPQGVNADGTAWTGRVDPQAFFQALFGIHEAHIYDATHVRVQEASISYTVPQRWFGTVPLQGVTVSAIGRNLGLLYKRTPHFDPGEAVSATNLQGFETGQIPPQRSFGLSVQFAF